MPDWDLLVSQVSLTADDPSDAKAHSEGSVPQYPATMTQHASAAAPSQLARPAEFELHTLPGSPPAPSSERISRSH